MYNILLIEDDRPLNKAISVYFKKEKNKIQRTNLINKKI